MVTISAEYVPFVPLAQTEPLEHISEDAMEYGVWNSISVICNVLFEFFHCCGSSR